MNTRNIDSEERVHQNDGVMIGDFMNLSSEYFGNQQIRNMTPRLPPAVMEAGCQQQNFSPERSSNSIMSRFESPAAFYATERCMRFPQYDFQYSKSYDSHQSSGPNYSIDIGQQSDHNFGLNSSLESIAKPHFSYFNSFDKSDKGLGSSSGNKLPSQQHNKFLDSHGVSLGNRFSVPFQGNQDRQVCCNPYSSPFARLRFDSREGKQSPGISLGGGTTSSGKDLPSKTRIRWTQDLHEKFVECVNRLGGAEKATPKAILKLMDSDGLTIFHVKSHLQKYRIAKYMPDPSEGKAEKRTSINDVSQLDIKTGFQIREALQLQLDVQRRLHEQLEIQRNLQLRIEEQGKQLKMMFDQQQKTTDSLLNNQNLDITSPDEPTFSLEDIDVSILEGSDYNTHFPSKIS
ncbi:MYB-LIKE TRANSCRIPTION FACTOR FAMILY PROTEIN [Salix viminalis]|uniref:MYB-LIKE TRANSCRIPTION FACTOR FAMILY PROTEIN n=1 Tax=Salix viminalis TaxID=40686 RepID=A0A9Q0V8J1_SALVM|nr:MYB-LIKE TRANSCRIPTION FACTOR FAMILY PROTEIN [Salix viminalis]